MQIKILRRVLLGILFLFTVSQLLPSCANTTAPPSGGEKDTLAPILLKVNPDTNKINFPVYGQKIELTFNEYVVLKDAEKNIVVSPPVKKRIETKVRGKSIIAEFPDSLKSETTYNIAFNSSIADNNEGNLLPPYRYSFSTGANIDSLIATAEILDAFTLLPIPNATLAFYENHSDSVLYNTLPSAIAKSDKWGYFTITNLKHVPYRVIAFTDDNGNNIYNPENEKLAFLDTLFSPVKVMKRGMEELKYVDPKDTTASLARKSDFRLYLFKEENDKQFIKKHERVSENSGYVKFNASDVMIDSLGFKEIDSVNLIKQFNIKRDSLVLWIKGDIKRIPDTLNLDIKYYKTDSTDKLTLARESLRFPLPRKAKQQDQRVKDRPEKRSNLLELKLDATPAMVEKDGYQIIFPAPIEIVSSDSIKFTSLTTKGVEKVEKYRIIPDSIEIRKYIIKPEITLQQGFDYILSLGKGAFKDISGNTNDSTANKIMLPKSEQLGRIDLDVSGINSGSFVIELINQSRDKIFRSYKISSDSKIEYKYLDPGKYSIRIFRDTNGNGILDSGILKERKQPEMVRLYKMPSGSEIIDLKEGMEIMQSINLNEIFK